MSSFANTSGGDLLFGVDEQRGLPVGLGGLTVSDFDQEIRRLDSIINDGLDSRIRFAIRRIKQGPKPPLLIIRVDRSWTGPHRVIFKGVNRPAFSHSVCDERIEVRLLDIFKLFENHAVNKLRCQDCGLRH